MKDFSCCLPASFTRPYAIWCGDSIDNHDVTTPEVFKEIIRITKDISNIHGPLALASATGLCHLWPARAVERRAEQGSPKLANPILVIGTSYDPVTPIASARKLVRRLNASGSRQAVMIHHDGTGHTSLAMHSACTKDIIKRYFAEGVVGLQTRS
ncbi:hypothetical protein FRC02_004761 [Tulasnella sp. 418]|nr:hypothetical protein FRC02_004761 [Tulasnella sp. 418]